MENIIIVSDAAQKYTSPQASASPYENNLLDLTLFVSSYNESEFIIGTLTTLVEVMKSVPRTYELIIIDDGSKDNSVALIEDFIKNHPEINIILRVNKVNKGLAHNCFDAAFMGHGKYFRAVCGDNSEVPDSMVKIFNMIGEADIIVPYYTSAEGKSAYRQVLSKIFTWIINLISGHKIKYYNGLHIHLRYNVMRWHPNTRGFGFQSGLLCLLLAQGFSYKQVPYVAVEKRSGCANAITIRNFLSVVHTAFDIFLWRVSAKIKETK